MFLSVFDMFKVGIGPSSSHTMGPMVAAARFLEMLRAAPFTPAGLRGSLHGSLAFTGVGHASDRATILGLAGSAPTPTTPRPPRRRWSRSARPTPSRPPACRSCLPPQGRPDLRFRPQPAGPRQRHDPDGHRRAGRRDPAGDLLFHRRRLRDDRRRTGGGRNTDEGDPVPYPFKSAAEMLEMAERSGKTIAEMKRANEIARGGPENLRRAWRGSGR